MTKRITKKLPVVYGIVRSKEPKDLLIRKYGSLETYTLFTVETVFISRSLDQRYGLLFFTRGIIYNIRNLTNKPSGSRFKDRLTGVLRELI